MALTGCWGFRFLAALAPSPTLEQSAWLGKSRSEARPRRWEFFGTEITRWFARPNDDAILCPSY